MMRLTTLACVSFVAILLTLQGTGRAQELIRIDGSSGVRPLVEALAEAIGKKSKIVKYEVGKGMGTTKRLEALADDTIQIATASHGVDREALKKRGMNLHTFAQAAVVFGVNEAVSISGLRDREICDIYSGKVTNWKQLGGTDLAITPLTRPDKEVDAEVVRAGIRCLVDVPFAQTVKVMAKSGRMARAIAGTPGAIGMTTSTRVARSKGMIRAIAIDGVAPTVANVLAGKYRFTRQAYLVTKAPTPTNVRAFIDFAFSEEGASVLKANGSIPVSR